MKREINMGTIGQITAIENGIENNIKLKVARENLSKEEFKMLYDSYKTLKKFQAIPAIIFMVVFVLELIFIPGESVQYGDSSPKETFIIMEVALFLMVIYPIWLIITQFICGKLWHKYSKWYKNAVVPRGIHDIFK